jgi:hypothetical protein
LREDWSPGVSSQSAEYHTRTYPCSPPARCRGHHHVVDLATVAWIQQGRRRTTTPSLISCRGRGRELAVPVRSEGRLREAAGFEPWRPACRQDAWWRRSVSMTTQFYVQRAMEKGLGVDRRSFSARHRARDGERSDAVSSSWHPWLGGGCRSGGRGDDVLGLGFHKSTYTEVDNGPLWATVVKCPPRSNIRWWGKSYKCVYMFAYHFNHQFNCLGYLVQQAKVH